VNPLELVRLPRVMALTAGRADVIVGLLDGPIALEHPDLTTGNIRMLRGIRGGCADPGSASCRHGTFVAGILAARRGAGAPAIAPDCTLLVSPIFSETGAIGGEPSASPGKLAEAIIDSVNEGARVLNVSASLVESSLSAYGQLEEALGYAARRGVLVVAAAGNQGAVSGSAIVRHPWVIPVIACDRVGWPLEQSNLGRSIGSRGLSAPGAGVASLAPEGGSAIAAGSSIAVPFVAGAAALLWSAFPGATAAEVKHALLSSPIKRRTTVIPPLLDASRGYDVLSKVERGVSRHGPK
jgi:subtilisin family serine protease